MYVPKTYCCIVLTKMLVQVMVVDMRSNEIAYYDSMLGSGHRYVKSMRRYLVDEMQVKRKLAIVQKWRLISRPTNVPQQTNGNDCGVFVCAFCFLISNRMSLQLFSQKHVPDFRRHIGLSIMKRRLYPNRNHCWNTLAGWSIAPGFVPYN